MFMRRSAHAPTISAVARRPALVCSAIVTLLVLSVGYGTAAASPRLAIDRVDTSRFPIVRVTITAARPTALRDLTVSEDGHDVLGLKRPNLNVTTAIALAVDTSRSMRGRRLKDVIAAASQFVRLQRSNDLVAVFGFAAKPYAVSSFSPDRASAIAALRRVAVKGPSGTATYAAVELIARDAGRTSVSRRALVLVTDGQSFRDPATLAQAINAAKASHLAIYPVVILTPVADVHALKALASATGGALVTTSNTRQLQDVYRSLSRELGGTYSFTYQSEGSWAAPIHLSVRAPGLGQATTIVHAPRPRVVTTRPHRVNVPTSFHAELLLAFGLIVGLGVVAIGSLRVLDLVRR
jgi:VWFA-related protein